MMKREDFKVGGFYSFKGVHSSEYFEVLKLPNSRGMKIFVHLKIENNSGKKFNLVEQNTYYTLMSDSLVLSTGKPWNSGAINKQFNNFLDSKD